MWNGHALAVRVMQQQRIHHTLTYGGVCMHHDVVFRHDHKPRYGHHPRDPAQSATFDATSEHTQGGEEYEYETGLPSLLQQDMVEAMVEEALADEQILRSPDYDHHQPNITVRRVGEGTEGTSTCSTDREANHEHTKRTFSRSSCITYRTRC